jgi:hypothetical protein
MEKEKTNVATLFVRDINAASQMLTGLITTPYKNNLFYVVITRV